ncbi:MAG: two-component system response regulator [candidate division Zixibacteria bacterium HGW-Zixibacteria-1]|nr:MAG: two-component system response regulator [candidate division Zixibacteria bacterium HGW-Zixibacteria-1]
MANVKVLIVDDEEDFRDILSQRMIARGFDVETAENGFKAIELASRKNFDAIILDLAMPEMDGLQTMEKLLAKDATLQIIMLTGQGTIQKGIEAVKMGAADFLEKPAEIETLVSKIEAAQAKKLALFTEELDQKISSIARKKGW